MMQASQDTTFAGDRADLFRLAARTAVLTLATLGFYRFWMKTRLRRYYWSSVRPCGVPVEYVGQPLEKLQGFLIAVVVLAFYIGVVNLVLVFATLSIFENISGFTLVSLAGIVPVWFYATYRARRYILARTRWRGIRFALDPGAWGYAWRALMHWVITILSIGLLWPRMTFWLEKYRTDRTWYGDLRLHQGGRWTMLYSAARPLLIGIALLSVSGAGLGIGTSGAGWGLAAAIPLCLYGLFHYRVRSLEILTSHKTAGATTFSIRPRVWRVIGLTTLGYTAVLFLSFVAAAAVLAVLGLVAGLILAAGTPFDLDGLLAGDGADIPLVVGVGLGLSGYAAFFLTWQVLRHTFVTLPVWSHYAESFRIIPGPELAEVRQRDRDHHTEAEGFVEALPFGLGGV